MTATVVTYNGVSISNVTVDGLDAQPEYDESGVILVGVRKTLAFSGLIQSADSADYVADLRQAQADLLVPRQQLNITVNGQTWSSIDPSGSGGEPGDQPLDQADAGSGPFPRGVRVLDVKGGRASRVSMAIEWLEPPDSDTDASDPVILSHRFSQTFTVAQNELVTRTVQGVLRLNGKFSTVNPDLFRHYVLPLELAGFQRRGLEFLVSEDGNTLVYRSVDQEGYRPFPVGILNAQMRCSVSQLGRGDSTKTKQISLILEADKYFPKNSLIDLGFTLMNERLGSGNNVNSSVVTEDVFGANSIQIEAEATVAAGALGRDSRYDMAATGLFRAVAADAGTRPAQGRFRQVQPYGQSLVRAAVQALFYAPSDGSPADLTEIATATAGRYDQATNRVDTDGDGYKEDFTEDAAVVGVDVTVAALPSDYDGSTLDIFLGDNDASGSGSNLLSADQVGETPYRMVRTRRSERLINFQVDVPIADPSVADRNIQLRSPIVQVIHEGEVWRVGAAPSIFVPPELADTSREWKMPVRDVVTLEPRPTVGGDAVEYGAKYRYVLQRIYDPSASEWTQDTAVTYAAGGSTTLMTYNGGQAIANAYTPSIDSGFTLETIDPSISGGVYA